MDINIITIHYHPFFFLKESLENNYNYFKKENIKFKHYLLDNNYPLEKQNKISDLCQQYNITYLNYGVNLGLVKGKNYVHETIKPKDIIFHLESDVYLLTKDILTNIHKTHENNDVRNVIYLNNKNLIDYDKNIFEINNIKHFELDIKNLNHTWIQCCHYNTNYQYKIQKILDGDKRTNYDFPGEKFSEFKEENIPLLIMNDFYEDMEKYRFSNYFEYEYFKALIYYWSKFEDEFKMLTFEDFIKNYDYYYEMDKFDYCFKNFKTRAKDYVIKPNFYFEKTKKKFNSLYSKNIIEKNKIDTDKLRRQISKLEVKRFEGSEINIKSV